MNHPNWIEWIYQHPVFRYLVSGSLAALVLFTVLTLMVEILGTPPWVASPVAFVIGALVNYTLQYHWTFQAEGSHRVMFTRFMLVTLATMSLNTALFWVFTVIMAIHYLISQALAIGLIIGVNYAINKHYTFASDS